MTEVALILSTIGMFVWFLTAMALFLVLVASYRKGQIHVAVVRDLTSTNIMLIRALRLQAMIMLGYERNIAKWYNNVTGNDWMIDERLRKEFANLLKGIEAKLKESGLKTDDQPGLVDGEG